MRPARGFVGSEFNYTSNNYHFGKKTATNFGRPERMWKPDTQGANASRMGTYPNRKAEEDVRPLKYRRAFVAAFDEYIAV
jgi:hypothetical protein